MTDIEDNTIITFKRKEYNYVYNYNSYVTLSNTIINYVFLSIDFA